MINAEKAAYPVGIMCRTLGLSRSGFYAWRQRGLSTREQIDEELLVHIRDAFRRNRGTYGSPRIQAELKRNGIEAGRHRVARLMRSNGIQARRRGRYQSTTDSAHAMPVAPNLLERRFDVEAADKVWAADITCLWTGEGWLYLAVILDLFSRRVVGWAMDEHMRQELALSALHMALKQRCPAVGLLHHSDRGSQYASVAYRSALEAAGIVCSMSRRGDCYDNAVVESFFGTLQSELEARSTWSTRDAARVAIHEYIEVFYNRKRSHSYLGYLSPAEYERIAQHAASVAA